jgi:glutathione peroxidase-family protein
MKTFSKIGFLLCLFTSFSISAAVNIGEKAPNFSLVDSNGKTHQLSDFKGKFVVLEWVNYDCPFVVKQYQPGKMQQLQKNYTSKAVIWLSINSSAKGKQGHFTPAQINQRITELKASPSAYLIDTDGKVGRMYGARSTPHMFILDPKQNLIYEGAIDDIRSANPDDVAKAKNYVETTLDAVLAGKPVPIAVTDEYGCSVKYQ